MGELMASYAYVFSLAERNSTVIVSYLLGVAVLYIVMRILIGRSDG